jgi:hypothetical protein
VAKRTTTPTSLLFFSKLKWIDNRPLMDTIEPYRRELFTKALDTYLPDGTPKFNLVLSGRAKKNNKTTDLSLAALYTVVIRRPTTLSNDAILLANDEDQSSDDLSLIRRIVEVNPELRREFEILQKELRLRDGSGGIRVLSAGVPGKHGKTYTFAGFDEIHDFRNWDLLEALLMDPSRPASLQWITSYDTIYNAPGVPLFDLKQIGKSGDDPRMLVSWYSADWCTDPNFAELPPEERANPSMSSWPNGVKYLAQQKRRLPSSKYRRLHLNLPGSPSGAFLDQGMLLAAVVTGRKSLPPAPNKQYRAFVDMSGGSKDEAVLCIAHREGRVSIIDRIEKQPGKPPFRPQDAIGRFCLVMREYGVSEVVGDNFGGDTFKYDFRDWGRSYRVAKPNKTELYEAFEPVLNAGEIQLLDHSKFTEQALTLVVKGSKIDHESNGHDDYINAVAGAVWLTREKPQHFRVTAADMAFLRNRQFRRSDSDDPRLSHETIYQRQLRENARRESS